MLAPCVAHFKAIARPIPRLAPVITIVLFFKLVIIITTPELKLYYCLADLFKKFSIPFSVIER
jgi:hypothetical protein